MDETTLNAILDALGRLPGMLVYGYYWTKVLDLRSVRLHWVIWLLFWAFQSALVSVGGGAGTVEASVLNVTSYLIYPALMSRDRIWYRTMVIVFAVVGCLMVEMAAALIGTLLWKIPPGEFRAVLDHPVAYIAMQTIILLLFFLLFYVQYSLFSRMMGCKVNPTLQFFCLGMGGRLVLLCTMLAVAEWYLQDDPIVLVATCIYIPVSVATDVLILLLVSRANAVYGQRVRSARLRMQLDESLVHFQELAGEIQLVARFRHDLRDELQAVANLVHGGDYVRADGLAAELEHRLALPMTRRVDAAQGAEPCLANALLCGRGEATSHA